MGTNYKAPIWRMPRNANKDKLSNYSIDFNPSDPNYIDCGDSDLLSFGDGSTDSPFSISQWWYMDSESSFRGISKFQSSTVLEWRLNTINSGILKFTLFDNSTSKYIGQASNANMSSYVNQWIHVVGTYDGSSQASGLKVYVNGEILPTTADSVGTYQAMHNTSAPVYLGRLNNNYANGKISQTSIFNYTLDQDQINYLYNLNNPMAITGAEPVAYWPLGDNSNPNAPGSFPNISVGADSVFDFDGTQAIDTPLIDLGIDASVSMWFNPDPAGPLDYVLLGYSAAGFDYVIRRSSGSLFVWIGPTFYGFSGFGSNVVSGDWNFLSLTKDRGEVTVYLKNSNGDFSVSRTETSWQTADLRFDRIGARSITPINLAFQGEISNVQAWDVTLLSTEIDTLYNNGQPLMTGTQPQEANLKAWYKLNQSANWEADTAGNWQIPDAVSSYPQSFDFDGSNYITAGDVNIIEQDDNGSLPYSISLWVNIPYSNATQVLLSKQPNSGSYNGFSIYRSNMKIKFSLGSGLSPQARIIGSSGFSGYFGTWTNICLTYDGSRDISGFNLYFNKETQTIATDANQPPQNVLNTADFEIGSKGGGSLKYIGKISNVQVWNTELSSTEVETLYNNGVPLTTAIATDNLKGWYKLDNNEKFDGTNWSIENQKYPANFESALDFNGTSDHITLPTITLADDWSVSVWMRHPIGKTRAQCVGTSTGIGFWAYGGIIRSGGSTAGKLTYYNGSSTIAISNERLDDGSWHHWIITYNNSTTTLKCFVDGEENYNDTYDAGTGNTINRISNTFASNEWKGELSNIAIFNTDLDSPAITALYNNGTPETSISSSPVSWWKLDNTITGIQDSAGSNDGTNNGATKLNTFVSKEAGESSGMTEQNLVNNNVSVLNGESTGMTTTALVQSNLTRKVPFSNYSVQFDTAGGDYARTTAGSNSILSGSTSFTISAWVNFADTASLRPIVTNWEAGTASYNYILRYNGGQLQLYVRANGASGNAAYGFTPTLNTWYNVVGTWGGLTGGTIQLYVNGVAVGTPGSRTGTMPTITVSDNIGLYTASGINYYMDGRLSNIAYWKNSLLSEDDILNIYNNGITQDLNNFRITPTNWFPIDESYTYFNGTSLILRDAIAGRDATGFNIVQENIVGNAPGSEASGVGSNFVIGYLEGNMKSSDKNAFSINMADYADGVTNPANSGRSTDTP